MDSPDPVSLESLLKAGHRPSGADNLFQCGRVVPWQSLFVALVSSGFSALSPTSAEAQHLALHGTEKGRL